MSEDDKGVVVDGGSTGMTIKRGENTQEGK
jgi:hypothetical protein